jgi:L-asparaginase II
MYCAALPEIGWGLALKMDDGNNARACEVAVAALFEALGLARTEAERALLAELSNVSLRNWRGTEVGRLAAQPELRRTLPQAGA